MYLMALLYSIPFQVPSRSIIRTNRVRFVEHSPSQEMEWNELPHGLFDTIRGHLQPGAVPDHATLPAGLPRSGWASARVD